MSTINRAFPGIFYVVRFPEKWQLYVYLFSPSEDIGHSEWFERTVASNVATAWAKTLGMNPRRIEVLIKNLCYAFPRGRVTKAHNHILILHGEDLTPEMGEDLFFDIERAFLIRGLFHWTFDDHERCQQADKDAMRNILGITEDWPAV